MTWLARHLSGSCAFVAAGAVSLLAVTPARANAPRPPQHASAVLQYIEAAPSTEGAQAVGVGKARRKPLPRKIDRRVEEEAGPAAGALRAVATSSAYGAPQQQLPARGGQSVSAAGLRAVTSGGSGREIMVLGVLLAAITVATLTVALTRRR